MNFKIDTKEKFTIITPIKDVLSDNLTAGLIELVTEYLRKDTKNVILNLKNIRTLSESLLLDLITLQQTFYENQASFVICELQPSVLKEFEKRDELQLLNITPSESEAWDMVQMEEIERELMDE